MRISWNWLSELIDLSSVGGPEKLADILTRRGLEVEAVERLDQGLEKVITVQILERKPHPQADRLSLCQVNTGSATLEIVCGAQNMKAGDKVALAQIGAELPNGLKIAQSKIRGVVSNGMLCSEEELKFKDKSEGILILPPSTPIGKPLADVLGRDDVILAFKLTANRGDCLSHWGMAREIAAAIGKKTKKPEAKLVDFTKSPISVHLDAGESAPQFYGIYIEGVKVGPSPAWLVKKLEAVGSRSINNVVDATNYVMLELGHPMHAYDAEKIEGKKLSVRMAKEGEQLPLLDGGSVTLAGTELVIADGKRAVGLAGVMGGGNSEVQDGTTKLFLECAEFDPILVRRAAAKHQRRTDAAQRFEKGIDPQGLPLAISRLARLITEISGGTIKGGAVAQHASRTAKAAGKRKIKVNVDYFADFLGMDVTAKKAEKILTDLDCEIKESGSSWTVTPPSYRQDLSIREDLAEEIARSLGYDQIRNTIPALTTAPRSMSENAGVARHALIERTKDLMLQAGLNETMNYPWTSRKRLADFGMKSSALVLNPLSEEDEALVPSLLPNLIKNVTDNWNHHFGSEPLAVRLFELRPTFHGEGKIEAKGQMETGIQERWKLAIALTGPRFAQGLRDQRGEVDFSDFKAVIENLLSSLGARGVRFQPMSASRTGGNSLLHPGQSVEILAGPAVAGHFGLIHPNLAAGMKARAPLWLAELDWEAIAKLSRAAAESVVFKPWPQFPSIERDFALLIKSDVSADKITQVAMKAGRPLAKVAKVFDIYRGSQVSQGMTSIAVRVIFYDETRSLLESEAETASTQILDAWKKELGAELRG